VNAASDIKMAEEQHFTVFRITGNSWRAFLTTLEEILAARANFLNDLKVATFKPIAATSSQTSDITGKQMSELKVSHGLAGRPIVIGPWRVTEASYSPGQRVPRHEHELPSWTFVLSGLVEETFSMSSFVCGAGIVLTKPASADHVNLYGPEPTRCVLIERSCAGDSSLYVKKLFSKPRVFSIGLVPRLAARICRERAGTDRVNRFTMESLLLELQLASTRDVSMPSSPGRKWLGRVRDQLEAEFRSPPSLSELARIHNLHPVYICQEFRSTFGKGIGDFVRDVRFEWACAAIAAGSGSLSDIALAAGFSDQSHMSRDFKKRLGVSPRRFLRTE
jgi:AraC family transcriptional regulator